MTKGDMSISKAGAKEVQKGQCINFGGKGRDSKDDVSPVTDRSVLGSCESWDGTTSTRYFPLLGGVLQESKLKAESPGCPKVSS